MKRAAPMKTATTSRCPPRAKTPPSERFRPPAGMNERAAVTAAAVAAERRSNSCRGTKTTHIVRSNFHNIYKHTRVANPYGHTIIIKGRETKRR